MLRPVLLLLQMEAWRLSEAAAAHRRGMYVWERDVKCEVAIAVYERNQA